MEKPKVFELTADYQPAGQVVFLRLWRREDRETGGDPIGDAAIAIGRGYSIALRLARRTLLDRFGLSEQEVLGA